MNHEPPFTSREIYPLAGIQVHRRPALKQFGLRRRLDNRDLDPPEPMVRILAATEVMREGEVLSALLCREPVFLFPELEKRGHRWRGGFEPDGKAYQILVRVGERKGAAA